MRYLQQMALVYYLYYIINIAPGNVLFQVKSIDIFFLFLQKVICCGYSSESPCRSASKVYPQQMFSWRHKKKIVGYPFLSGAMNQV